MPDMRLPYAYIEAEADRMEYEARNARDEVRKYQAIADTCEEQARKLRFAIKKQTEVDEERVV